MSEPTSALTFASLQLEVALKLGIAYYGSDGSEAAQVPTDVHDLALVNRLVNNGIRMFIHDGPQPNGWRWTKLTASLSLWPDITESTTTVSGGAFAGGLTTITASAASFYPSMIGKTIVIDTVGSFVVQAYTSTTVIVVTGNASAAAADDWTMTSDGNFTLPDTFGGEVTGMATYAAGTNRGFQPRWTDESVIRMLRADTNQQFGTPNLIALRPMDIALTAITLRRRWELLVHTLPNELLVLEFPYLLHFDALTTAAQVPPAPFTHDETIKAACLAAAELDVEDTNDGPRMANYQKALQNSYRVDALSAPKTLGYNGNGREPMTFTQWRSDEYQRPTVTINL